MFGVSSEGLLHDTVYPEFHHKSLEVSDNIYVSSSRMSKSLVKSSLG